MPAFASVPPEPPHPRHLGRVPKIDHIGEVKVAKIRARPDEHGDAHNVEAPGAGEVDSVEGGFSGDGGEGGVGCAHAKGEVEAGCRRVVSKRDR